MAELAAALARRRQKWADEIQRGLFLGSGSNAENLGALHSHGITHVLNVADDVPNFHEGEGALTYCRLDVQDFGADAGISRTFGVACDFIEGALANEGKVLVHCANGSNRSPTIVIAVLMKLNDWNLRTAFDHVRRCHQATAPLKSESAELISYEIATRGGEPTMVAEDFTRRPLVRATMNRTETASYPKELASDNAPLADQANPMGEGSRLVAVNHDVSDEKLSTGDERRGIDDFLSSPSDAQRCAKGVEVVRRVELKSGSVLCVSSGSVTSFGGSTDWAPGDVAIVNAANCGGLKGGGVDGEIVEAGGPALAADRKSLPIIEGTRMDRIETGGARATGPNKYGRLFAGTVIHAVGPNYLVAAGCGRPLDECDKLLFNAYASSLAIARERGIRYLGCSLLSAGVFRGQRSLQEVLQIAIDAAREHSYGSLAEVHLVAFTEDELKVALECVATC
eukprot:TRINITY_DN14280_c0_g2_i1.p1 TRINITY_DN14280_c0_g2~~TRINITY_DN14280_c0_g2_i1.p1  ORF type:complete len:454 (+),score=62.56 TRINITY_DN14280_c0_g2_i1:55-1416(+)